MRRGWLCAAVALAALAGGCATTHNPADLMAQPQVARTHAQTVGVTFSNLTTGSWTPDTSAAFTESIVSAIDRTHLFSRVVSDGKSDYVLSVVLVTMDTPLFGVSMTAHCEMGWTLARPDGSKVWQQMVSSSGTATGGEAFAGVERVRMARDRAVRDNVTQALTQLGRVDF